MKPRRMTCRIKGVSVWVGDDHKHFEASNKASSTCFSQRLFAPDPPPKIKRKNNWSNRPTTHSIVKQPSPGVKSGSQRHLEGSRGSRIRSVLAEYSTYGH